ncbi:MAG: tetratricopeptide repeat protein [Candidatus Neomarinimicrobiota bacterium]
MLRPKKKITKKEMKKDPMLEKISQVDTFVRSNPKQLLYGALGVVVLVALVVLLAQSKKSANREASGELGMAEIALAKGDIDDAVVRLEALIEKNPRTKSAGMATLLLAQSYLTKSDYDKAQENFEKYVDDFDDDEMIEASALNGVGLCLDHKGEYKKAAKIYAEAADESPYKFQKHEYSLNAVRSLIKINELKEAEEMVQRVLNDEPDYKAKSAAEQLQAQIEVLKG